MKSGCVHSQPDMQDEAGQAVEMVERSHGVQTHAAHLKAQPREATLCWQGSQARVALCAAALEIQAVQAEAAQAG